jgi:hypothetical protein
MGNGGLAQCTTPIVFPAQANVPVDSQEFEYAVTTGNEYDAGDFCVAEGVSGMDFTAIRNAPSHTNPPAIPRRLLWRMPSLRSNFQMALAWRRTAVGVGFQAFGMAPMGMCMRITELS